MAAYSFYPHQVRVRTFDAPTDEFRQLEAFQSLYELGYDNLEILFPLVDDAEDVHRARSVLEDVGIDPENRPWGVMIETPASALGSQAICEAGVAFISFGTNDLTQYTLAVDRNNSTVADRYDALHPSVLRLLTETIETCRSTAFRRASGTCGFATTDDRNTRRRGHHIDERQRRRGPRRSTEG